MGFTGRIAPRLVSSFIRRRTVLQKSLFMGKRKNVEKEKENNIFPFVPSSIGPSKSYPEFVDALIETIRKQRVSTTLRANVSLIVMYWQIGDAILKKQKSEGWGAKVIDRISHDVRHVFPDMKGFSPRNIKYMRLFAAEWPDLELVQRTVALIPWRTNILILEKIKSPEDRLWYAQKTIKKGWSRSVLELQIESGLKQRDGQAVNNFESTLPSADSDLVSQVFKDPYLFDFLGTDVPRREREIEQKLTEHIQSFLLELGQGFAFVGRQVHLELGGQDFYIDMLFYHLNLRCYIVIELKACEFEPEFVSKVNMYRNAVDDLLKRTDDKPTIGLLLVKGKNRTVVEYSLAGYSNPIGVADWESQIVRSLPEELKSNLPAIEDIEKELNGN